MAPPGFVLRRMPDEIWIQAGGVMGYPQAEKWKRVDDSSPNHDGAIPHDTPGGDEDICGGKTFVASNDALDAQQQAVDPLREIGVAS